MKFILIIYIIIKFLINEAASQYSNCNISRVQYGAAQPQVIFEFQCFSPTSNDPPFPTGGSLPSEFNQLLMSPNMYTSLPTANICQFINVIRLDVSFNLLTSIAGLFQRLKCLVQLTTLIISNNFISSALVQSDFDDTLSQQLVWLDFSNNQISSIDTKLFFKSDGTSRFSSLQYLNLAFNNIVQFDMLMPLTIPNNNINFSLNSNPVNTLINQLNASYNDIRFAYPAIGNRIVSITNNALTVLDDTNLLQYGLTSRIDLELFLNKIANFDLRQTNNNIIKCPCTNGTTKLVSTWYKSLLSSSLINQKSLVNQLTCAAYNQSAFLSDPTCQSNSNGSFGALEETQKTTTSVYYAFLFLLLIPLILFLLTACCCLRPINKFLFKKYNTTCFSSCRPGDTVDYSLKNIDASIVYSELDEQWVDTNLLSKLSRNHLFKVHKLTSYNKSLNNMGKDVIEIFSLSKRIVLVFSKNFLEEEWKSDSLRNEIKILSVNDPDCVIIPINYDLDKREMNKYLSELQDYNSTSCHTLNQHIRYSLILRNVEPLSSNAINFFNEFKFLMPIKEKQDNTEVISIKNKTDPSIQSISGIKFENEIDFDHRSNYYDDKKPFVSKKSQMKTKIEPSEQDKLPSLRILKSDTDSDCPSILDYSFNSFSSASSQPKNFDFEITNTTASVIHKPQPKRLINNLPFIREETSREDMHDLSNKPLQINIQSYKDNHLPRDLALSTLEKTYIDKISFENPIEQKNGEDSKRIVELLNRKSHKELKPKKSSNMISNDAKSEYFKQSSLEIKRLQWVDHSVDSTRKRKKNKQNADDNLKSNNVKIKSAKTKKKRLELLENMLSLN